MPERFAHLVLDTAPLIAKQFSISLAQAFYTVPEVIAELKDEDTRKWLSSLPFELKILSPNAETTAMVREFAKETGDLASLSVADLRVIALTVMLERKINGEKSSIRTKPIPATIYKEEGGRKKRADVKPEASSPQDQPTSDLDTWITPENITAVKIQAQAGGVREKDESANEEGTCVGCMTTDFAVQNVLLQMGLRICSPEGIRIRGIKSWLLRCHGCFWTSKDMERRFCDKCGGNTLSRISYMIDAQGEVRLFLKRDFQRSIRGTKYSMPMPQPGRNGNNILLREDQREYIRAMKEFERQERRALRQDEGVDNERLATAFGSLDIRGISRTAAHHLVPPAIGFGKRNPNAARHRK